MTEHCSWTESLGAYLLGGLVERERLAMRAHLDGCETCSTALGELQPVARLVATADFDRVCDAFEPSPALGLAVLSSARRVTRRHRWARAGALVAAAAVLLAVLGLVRPGDSRSPAGQRIELVGLSGVQAWVDITSVPAGTYAVFHSKGLPGGKVYRMWFEDEVGQRVPVGTFRGVDGSWLACPTTTALTVKQLTAVGASDETGTTVLRAPLPRGAVTVASSAVTPTADYLP